MKLEQESHLKSRVIRQLNHDNRVFVLLLPSPAQGQASFPYEKCDVVSGLDYLRRAPLPILGLRLSSDWQKKTKVS